MTSLTFAVRTDDGTIYLMNALLLLIFLPTSLFFSYQLYKRRLNVTITKRYPVLSISATILFIFRLITSSITLLLLVTTAIDPSYFAYRLLLFIDNLFLYSFFTVMLWRIWNIHYDVQWINQSLYEDQWRAVISPQDVSISNASHKLSFYLTHNATFGTSKYIGKVLSPVMMLIFCGLVQIPLWISDDLSDDTNLYALCARITLIFVSILLILLIMTTPKTVAGQRDAFFIISELRILCLLSMLLCIVAVVALVYGQSVYDIRTDQRRFLYILIEESLYFAIEWLMVMVSTFLVLTKTGELFAKYQSAQIRGRKRSRMINMDNTVNTQFYRALESQDVFDSFMRHLAADFQVTSSPVTVVSYSKIKVFVQF